MSTSWVIHRVGCPKCGAGIGEPCIGFRYGEVYNRKANHRIRRQSAATAPKPHKPKSSYGDDWATIRARVFAQKGSQCEYCGADASHVDHKVPLSRGGTNDIDNLAPCCPWCNRDKGTRTLAEWQG